MSASERLRALDTAAKGKWLHESGMMLSDAALVGRSVCQALPLIADVVEAAEKVDVLTPADELSDYNDAYKAVSLALTALREHLEEK